MLLLIFVVILSSAFALSSSYSKYVISRSYTINIASILSYPITGVSIDGTARVGETLNARVYPEEATASYSWYSGTSEAGPFVKVPDVTINQYSLGSSDLDQYIKVEVTGTGDYTGTASATVGPVVSPLPPITAITIDGIVPVRGEMPIYNVTGTDYTAAVTWSPVDFDGQGRFKNNVQYTAVMTITPAAGYSITADTSLSVVGATSVNINYGPDSVIVTAIFPLTSPGP